MTPLEALEAKAALEARKNFYAFRQHINVQEGRKFAFKRGWWQREVCNALQGFYHEFAAGKRPKLVIEAPPQMGKSVMIIDFIAWLIGHRPETKTMYTSFSKRLGVRANLRLRRIMDSERYQRVFPGVLFGGDDKQVNLEIVEMANGVGSFRNTTVGGPATGEGLDLGVCDDPMKGRKEADSETFRDSTWDWFTDVFLTRFSEESGLLCILTRWHLDDPIGRLRERDPSIKVLSYKAIAEVDEKNRKAGEALFPEHKSLAFLLERKKVMNQRSWESLYQQNPTEGEGNIYKREYWQKWKAPEPPELDFVFTVYDTAFEEKQENDYSAAITWGVFERTIRQPDDKEVRMPCMIMLDAWKEQYSYPDLKDRVIDDQRHRRANRIIIEKAASGRSLIQDLRRVKIPGFVRGLPVVAFKPSDKSKQFRANIASEVMRSRCVFYPERGWAKMVIDEAAAFPRGKNDDLCFVAGTMIATSRGNVPIESVAVGTMVLTPFGFRRVVASHCTGNRRVVSRLGLQGTEKHPVYTIDKGYVHHYTIGRDSELVRNNICDSIRIALLMSLNTMVLNIEGWEGKENITSLKLQPMPNAKVLRGFMSLFGSLILKGKFLKATKLITLMATHSTVILITLSVFRWQNIVGFLRGLQKSRETGSFSIFKPSENKRRSGTGLLKDGNGTTATLIGRLGRETFQCMRKSVSGAVRDSAPQDRSQYAVAIHAGRASVIDESISYSQVKSEPALSAEKSSTPLNRISPSCAASHAGTNITKTGESTILPVYNIEVEEAHCYYANGILVHNCDVLTMSLLFVRQKFWLGIEPDDETDYFDDETVKRYYG